VAVLFHDLATLARLIERLPILTKCIQPEDPAAITSRSNNKDRLLSMFRDLRPRDRELITALCSESPLFLRVCASVRLSILVTCRCLARPACRCLQSFYPPCADFPQGIYRVCLTFPTSMLGCPTGQRTHASLEADRLPNHQEKRQCHCTELNAEKRRQVMSSQDSLLGSAVSAQHSEV
jgi:hypothetical protein